MIFLFLKTSLALLEAELAPFKDWAKSSSSLDHPHNAAIRLDGTTFRIPCLNIYINRRGQNLKNDLDKTKWRKSHQMKRVFILLGLVVSFSTFLWPIRGRTSFSSPLVIFFQPLTSFLQSRSSSLMIMKSWIPTTWDALSKTEVFLNLQLWNVALFWKFLLQQ